MYESQNQQDWIEVDEKATALLQLAYQIGCEDRLSGNVLNNMFAVHTGIVEQSVNEYYRGSAGPVDLELFERISEAAHRAYLQGWEDAQRLRADRAVESQGGKFRHQSKRG